MHVDPPSLLFRDLSPTIRGDSSDADRYADWNRALERWCSRFRSAFAFVQAHFALGFGARNFTGLQRSRPRSVLIRAHQNKPV